MKKQLFGGYSVRETEVMLGVLKEENKVLQQQIAEIKRMISANDAAGSRKKTRLPIKRVDDAVPAVLAAAEETAAVETQEVAKEPAVVEEASAAEVVTEEKAETVEVCESPASEEAAEEPEVLEKAAEPAAEIAEPVENVSEEPEAIPEDNAAQEICETAEPSKEAVEETKTAVIEAPEVKKTVKVIRVRAVKPVAVAAAEPVAEVEQETVTEETIEAVPMAEEPGEVAETVPEVVEAAAEEVVEETDAAIAPEEPTMEAEAEMTPEEPVTETVEEVIAQPEPAAVAVQEVHSNLFDISMRKHDAMIEQISEKPIEAILPEDIDGVVCIENSVIKDIGSTKDEIAELRKRLVRMQEYLEAVQRHKEQLNNKRLLEAFHRSGKSVEDVLSFLEKKNRFDVSGG